MVIEKGGNGVEMQSTRDDSSEPPGLSRKSTPRKMRTVDSMEVESIRVTRMENHGFPKTEDTGRKHFGSRSHGYRMGKIWPPLETCLQDLPIGAMNFKENGS
ncbi:hypothetical protein O6H91_04G099300 [Diphasiastrum complanatum]|uniref:Uncharacterized protein n=1 Tax=Diphasiastrum complanatum TaxID=34168 RepID=A0ACC2DZY2_DIPCM|nr:hypothetical protein O6H91_04G099300 [Diphasiastrum complanatum]